MEWKTWGLAHYTLKKKYEFPDTLMAYPQISQKGSKTEFLASIKGFIGSWLSQLVIILTEDTPTTHEFFCQNLYFCQGRTDLCGFVA